MRNSWTYTLAIILFQGWVGAATIQVPADAPTIQQALYLAVNGDTIVVAEGVYSEYIQFLGKDLTLTSNNPNDWGVVSRTILQVPSGYYGPVVRFGGSETSACLVTGLTIQNGQDGGIRGNNTQATISRCWVRNNSGSTCGGIWGVIGLIDRCRITGNYGGTPGNTGATGGLTSCGDISNCLIADNVSSGAGGMSYCPGVISNCLIVNNRGSYFASGMAFCTGTIVHCTIANNTSPQYAVGMVACSGTITNCIIWRNTRVDPITGQVGIRDVSGSDPTYSCYSNAPAENGNLSADPLLGPGYSLMAGSPCIDAGTNTPPTPLAAVDYRGANRMVDGDDAASVVTDMGAFEFDPLGISLVVQPERLEFGGAEGISGTPVKTFEIYNLDGYSGAFDFDTAGAAWLTIEPASGTLSQTAQTISVRVDPTGLAVGDYTCNLGVVVDGSTRLVVPIVLHVGNVLRVPQDAAKIQTAITQAADWDTVLVSPGEYKENLDFLGKKIVLRSIDPQDLDTVKSTIINGRCLGSCVSFTKGEGLDSIVEGLTIQLGSGSFVNHPSGSYQYVGGGVLCVDSSPTIRRCQIAWNGYRGYSAGVYPPEKFISQQFGGGIGLIGNCQARIEDCLLVNNAAYSRGAAIYAKPAQGREHLARTVVERCTIADNTTTNINSPSQNYDVDGTLTQLQIRNVIAANESVHVATMDQIRDSCITAVLLYTGAAGTLVDITGINGNITGNPRFVSPYSSSNPAGYDYRLKALSPCINHGDAGFAGDGQKDLAGNKRVMAGRLDMGAFEFVPETRVIHPMEGDVWAAGSRHPIVWEEPKLDRIVISNGGFEDSILDYATSTTPSTNKDENVLGWTVGPNSGAMYNPGQFDWMPSLQSKPTGFDRGSGVYQLLVDSFRPNSRYTLKLFVGSRKDMAAVTNWQAALTAGDRSTVVAAVTQAELGIPGLGKWIAVSLDLETGAEGVDANVGKRIGILLTGAPRVEFDEASIEVAELNPTATVDIKLSINDGQTWQTIADDVADTGSYLWTIPSDIASESCRILVASERWPDFIWVPGSVFSIRPYQAGAAVESRWPTEGHDMQRTGLTGDNGPERGCVKWVYSTVSPIAGSPVIGPNGRILLAGDDRLIHCLGNDGTPIWTYATHGSAETVQGCWRMNDGSGSEAADCRPGERPGTLVNFAEDGSQWVQDATYGTVLEFDGINDYVRIPTYKGIAGSNPRICEAWIKTTQANADILCWGKDNATGQRWRIRLQDRNGIGVLKAEINGGNILGSTPVNTGEWVHVRVILPAGKSNSKDILLYVNGVLEPSESASILPIEIQTGNELDVTIGAHLYSGSFFQGQMRDVRISTPTDAQYEAGGLSVGPDGTVYTGDRTGVLYAIDGEGQLRWTHQTKAMIAGAPAIGSEGKVFFGSVDGTIVALGADGSELWSFAVPGPGKVGGAVVASPTLGRDGNVYVGGLYDGKLYALASGDGRVEWTCDFDGGTANQHSAMANAPAVGADGTIYATLINDPKLYAIDPDDGSIVWTTNLAGTAGGYFGTDYPTRFKEVYPWASPAVGPDGTIFVAFDDPYLRAVNPDGSIRWVTRLGMVGGFSLSVGADGKIFAAGDDRSLYVLDAEGTILSRFDGSNWLSWPVIGVDETLYVSDFSGILSAIAPQPCEGKAMRLARPADITLDGKVRLEDLAELAKDWKECTDTLTGSPCVTTGSGWKRFTGATYLCTDIDRDTYIGLSDLLAMAEQWMDE